MELLFFVWGLMNGHDTEQAVLLERVEGLGTQVETT